MLCIYSCLGVDQNSKIGPKVFLRPVHDNTIVHLFTCSVFRDKALILTYLHANGRSLAGRCWSLKRQRQYITVEFVDSGLSCLGKETVQPATYSLCVHCLVNIVLNVFILSLLTL